MRYHKFIVRSFNGSLTEDTALAVLAISKLPNPNGYNMMVPAIKYLRNQCNAGLYEAKQIADFIAEKGRVNNVGQFFIEETPPLVAYALEDV